MGKIVQLVPSAPRKGNVPETENGALHSWFSNGLYRIVQMDGSRITVCGGRGRREKAAGTAFHYGYDGIYCLQSGTGGDHAGGLYLL